MIELSILKMIQMDLYNISEVLLKNQIQPLYKKCRKVSLLPFVYIFV